MGHGKMKIGINLFSSDESYSRNIHYLSLAVCVCVCVCVCWGRGNLFSYKWPLSPSKEPPTQLIASSCVRASPRGGAGDSRSGAVINSGDSPATLAPPLLMHLDCWNESLLSCSWRVNAILGFIQETAVP